MYVAGYITDYHFSHFISCTIHLDVSPEESMRRIKKRNRDCESTITLEFLQKLYSAYEAFITDIACIIPVIHKI